MIQIALLIEHLNALESKMSLFAVASESSDLLLPLEAQIAQKDMLKDAKLIDSLENKIADA
jgi:hypothetical protein